MIRKMIRTIVCLAFVLAPLFSVNGDDKQSGDNWPRFRGPNGSGISQTKTIPVQWTDKEIRWSVELPGTGNSSPVIWGEKVFVTAADEQTGQRSLLCLSTKTGQVEWQKQFAFEKYRKHKNNSFASSTPAVDSRHVYVLLRSPSGSPLIAFTHAGEQVWEYDLGEWTQGQGGASSPISDGRQVYVCNDHREGSALFAFDARTGRECWKIPREGKRACFSTPCLYATNAGRQEIIFTHCYEGIIGVSPDTGKQNWHIDVFGTHSQRAVGSPIIVGRLIVGSSGGVGGKRNIVAVEPLPNPQDGRTAEEKWRIFKSAPHVPTPIATDKHLFLWEDKGVVSVYDANAGKVLAQKRVGGTYFASPIIVDGKMYNIDLTGKVFVVSADEKLDILARNTLPEGSRASFAVGDGRLFARTHSRLFCLATH